MRNNIDAWWPFIEKGAEAIVITASGCGSMIKDYGHALAEDTMYSEKAKVISKMTKDLSEVFIQEHSKVKEDILTTAKKKVNVKKRVAFLAPCSLQHGQQIKGTIENMLRDAGFELTRISDSHLCCGSAGTYSLLQPKLSEELLRRKITSIEENNPELIVSANIGCLTQLQSATKKKVIHWAELLEETLSD